METNVDWETKLHEFEKELYEEEKAKATIQKYMREMCGASSIG